MVWNWLASIRGQLVAWYLSVLALLLLGLCMFQTIILMHYVHAVRAAGSGRSSAAATAILQVRLVLIVGALIVFLVTAIVALPIINRALRPLYRITETAEAIAAGNFEERARLADSVDEIGRLGQAFDLMVDRLQSALSVATASEERMRQFLADASHELRTPLTVLCGTSQVLLRHQDLDAVETRAALVAIHEEAARLSRLVNDLLTLSRLDGGQQLVVPHPVPVSCFLEEFVARYAPAWPDRIIAVRDADLSGVQADVDPEALRRVLTNLVDNAARYSTAGRPITISGALGSSAVTIAVNDEGPGLSPEDAARVFERFYRGNKSRSRLNGGSGLGLAIVCALVHQSRGKISIDTGLDRGTTVAVTLPRLPEHPQPSMN